MMVAIFSIIKAPHRKPTKSPRLLSYNKRQRRDSEETAKRQRRDSEETAKQLAKTASLASRLANMSAPRWMMEGEFEPEGYAYEDYDENEKFYTEYDDGMCTICMGGSFVRRIYIGYESEGDYEEDYDY